MRKFLSIVSVFIVFSFNVNASSRDYYDNIPKERPYNERVRYSSSHYKPVSHADQRQYNERKALREKEYENTDGPRFYIGGDVATTKMKFGAEQWMKGYDGDDGFFEDDNKAISGVVGLKINKYVGIEAFYQQSNNETHRDNTFFEAFDVYGGYETTTIKYKSYGIDILGYIPITQEIELLTSLGLAQYDFKTTINDHLYNAYSHKYEKAYGENKNFDSLGVRIGLGAQYNFTEHLALRAMARYIQMNDDDYVKNMTEFSMGLRYMF